jgi:hypothetical protein
MSAALEYACRKDGESVWDRDWLEFKITDNHVVKFCSIGQAVYAGLTKERGPMDNLRVVFSGDKLISAQVIQ